MRIEDSQLVYDLIARREFMEGLIKSTRITFKGSNTPTREMHIRGEVSADENGVIKTPITWALEDRFINVIHTVAYEYKYRIEQALTDLGVTMEARDEEPTTFN